MLTEGVRASAGAGIRKLSRALVVSEIALAFTLLAVSAILIVHLRNLTRVATGFDPDRVLTFQLTLSDAVLLSPRRVPYQTRLVEALEAIPSVSRAGFANQIPLDGCCLGGTAYPEGGSSNPDVGTRRLSVMYVSPGYFQAMGIRLRKGRFLNEADIEPERATGAGGRQPGRRQPGTGRTAIRLAPSGEWTGRTARDFKSWASSKTCGTMDWTSRPKPRSTCRARYFPWNPMRVVVRSPLPAAQLIPEIRRAVQQVDPTLPVYDPKPMNAILGESLQLRRVTSLMMTGFGGAALLMATLGIYGVVSYSGAAAHGRDGNTSGGGRGRA